MKLLEYDLRLGRGMDALVLLADSSVVSEILVMMASGKAKLAGN